MRRVRGTHLDLFGRDRVRVEERRLIEWYIDVVQSSMDELKLQNKAAVLDIARLPDAIRGYEDIKMRTAAEATQRAEVLRGRLKNSLSLPLMTTENKHGQHL